MATRNQQQQQEPSAGGQQQQPPAQALTKQDISDLIDEKLSGLLPQGAPAPAPAPARSRSTAADAELDVATQVQREVAKIQEAQERRQRDTAVDTRLNEIGEQVNKIQNAPPKEYRRVTELFWGDKR